MRLVCKNVGRKEEKSCGSVSKGKERGEDGCYNLENALDDHYQPSQYVIIQADQSDRSVTILDISLPKA